jgi:hypothetical protein
MTRRIAVAAGVLAAVSLCSEGLSACGDKFLLFGRGVRFQRAYAAIHPAAILIVVPPKSVKNAAVRDSRLQSALTMAGHRVDVVKPVNLAEALARFRYDIILAERTDAMSISEGLPAGPRKPAVVGVLEEGAAGDLAAARQRLDGVLKTPQPLKEILSLFDDVMKTRLDRTRAAAF